MYIDKYLKCKKIFKIPFDGPSSIQHVRPSVSSVTVKTWQIKNNIESYRFLKMSGTVPGLNNPYVKTIETQLDMLHTSLRGKRILKSVSDIRGMCMYVRVEKRVSDYMNIDADQET